MHYVKATAIVTVCIAVALGVMALVAMAWYIIVFIGLVFAVACIIKSNADMDKKDKGL